MEQDACSDGNETLVLNFWILCTNETIFSLSFVLNTLVIGYDALSDHPWGPAQKDIVTCTVTLSVGPQEDRAYTLHIYKAATHSVTFR